MPVSPDGLNKLKQSGYKYYFTNDIYVNKINKIIISKEAVEDHDNNWLDEKLKASNDDDWLFIFTDKNPSDVIKNKILKEIGFK